MRYFTRFSYPRHTRDIGDISPGSFPRYTRDIGDISPWFSPMYTRNMICPQVQFLDIYVQNPYIYLFVIVKFIFDPRNPTRL